MERVLRILISIIMMIGCINTAVAAATAISFQLPLDNYPTNDGCLAWGGYNSAFPGTQHVADDACASAGTDVLAVANGIVKFAGPYKSCSNWGYLMIIEHTLSNGSVVNSIYGHIAPISGISAGVEVTRGQHIGEIVSMSCWSDHIHFGIYDGPYSEITCTYDTSSGSGSCNAHGYLSDWPGKYLDPIAFISSHQIPSDAYTAITIKADELWAKGLILYEPEGGNMHWYGGPDASDTSFIIEDWDGGSWDWVALTYDPATNDSGRAYVLRHGFWNLYRNNGGPDTFGAPLGDEMDRTQTIYTPFDSYWGTDVSGAITNNCGPTSQFTSVQRFEQATFCWYEPEWRACLSSPNDAGYDPVVLPYCYELTDQAVHQDPTRSLNVCAPEVWDNVDNDCDGLIDEIFDRDYDGYTEEQGDCSPTADHVYPGCPELNDDIDNDCDSVIDEGYPSPEDQYVFFDFDGNGDDDPCVRRNTVLLCLYDGLYGTWNVFEDVIGSGEYLITRSGRTHYFDYAGADGIADYALSYGEVWADEFLYWHQTIVARFGTQLQIDRNIDGIMETYLYYGQAGDDYYLADLNGDHTADLIVRRGNMFYVDTNTNGAADYWFTYGNSSTDTQWYFADMDGNGKDGIIVIRGNLLYVCDTITPNASNTAHWTMSYGNGL